MSYINFILFLFFFRDDDELAESAIGHFSLIALKMTKPTDEIWTILLQNIISCSYEAKLDERKCSEQAFKSVIIQFGCQNQQLSPKVWKFIVLEAFSDLFQLGQEGDYLHDVDLLHDLIKNLLHPFREIFVPYRSEILTFLSKLFSAQSSTHQTDCSNFKLETIDYLNEYIEQEVEGFKEPELNKQLLDELEVLLPNMYFQPKYISVLKHCFMLFNNLNLTIDKVIELLDKCVLKCQEKVEIITFHAWCSALEALIEEFYNIKREDELNNWLELTFITYIQRVAEKSPLNYWDELVVNSLNRILKMDDALFNSCMKKNLKLICELIEVESSGVRNSVTPILQRQLAKQIGQ